MKSIARLILCLALTLPALAFSNDKLQCAGISFDIKKNQDGRPSTVILSKEDQQFHLVFSGKLDGNLFRVVIQKSSNEVHGSIDRANGETMTFNGTLNNNGFDFGAYQGVMIPVKSIGIVCHTQE